MAFLDTTTFEIVRSDHIFQKILTQAFVFQINFFSVAAMKNSCGNWRVYVDGTLDFVVGKNVK